MREMTIPESGSKRKLLDAAELLFAEKGFEAVSVRDITQYAKTNVAAVNYHFGSRDNLLALVMMRYMTPVTEERIQRLDELENQLGKKAIPLEDIIDALVRPLVGQVKKSELTERLFYKLTGRICAEQGNGLPPQIEEQFRQAGERFSKAFAKTLPTVPMEELAWRIHFIIGGMIHMLTHQEILFRVSGGVSGAPTMEVTLKRFIDFAAAGLREGTQQAPKPEPESAKPMAVERVAVESAMIAPVIAGSAMIEPVVVESPVTKTVVAEAEEVEPEIEEEVDDSQAMFNF